MSRLVPCSHSHYNLNSETSSFIADSLSDLNAIDAASNPQNNNNNNNSIVDGISDGDRDSLNNDDDSASADCVHQSYGSTLQLQGVSDVEQEHSLTLESDEPSRAPYGVLTTNDVMPIESARARFLQLILDHFLKPHVVEAPESPDSVYSSPNGKDKQKRKKPREAQYEGDSTYVLPLAYVANLYETLVNEANMRLSTLEGLREKTMGVALEAAGGLYRHLVKKFPRKGSCTFKRREMASALEAKTKFPELVTREEKRVRFVVVHGIEIVEQPLIRIEDAEWFKRLTGRHEASISERDYKFYSARHKYRRTPHNSLSSITGLPAFPNPDTSPTLMSPSGIQTQYPNNLLNLTSQSHMQHSHQPHISCLPHHNHHQQLHQAQAQHHHQSHQPTHLSPQSHRQHCAHASQLEELSQAQHVPSVAHHISRSLQSTPGLHVGGRMIVLPTGPSKFCDQCGSPFLRETSKFCSECGAKRLENLDITG